MPDPQSDAAPADGPAHPDRRIARWLATWQARAQRVSARYQQEAERRPVLALPLTFLARYTGRQGMLLASAVAFRLFLWLLPLALLSAGILAAIANEDQDSVESASRNAGITGAASQQVVTALREGHQSWWVAVLFGAILFLWGTRTLMRNLTVVNAHAWDAPVPKPRQKDVLITTVQVAIAWIALFVFAAVVTNLDHLVAGGVVLAIVVQSVADMVVWFTISLRLPDRRRDWIDLVPGTVLFGAGLAIMSAFSRIYLPRRFEHSSNLYGTLGIASVILAWLLLIGQLLVVSTLVNSMWCDYRVDRAATPPASDQSAEAGAEPPPAS